MLFDLRQNVSDLRRELNGLRKQIDETNTIATQGQALSQQYVNNLEAPHTERLESVPVAEDAVAEEISDVDFEQESLNLNEQERRNIIKALERNHGNRKKTAQELGISDRTLYRKINLYGLAKN